MKIFILITLTFAVASGTVIRRGSYGTQRQPPTEDAGASPPSYGAQERVTSPGAKVNCEETYQAVQVDKCEPYVDKVCTTIHTEACVDVQDRNCHAIVNYNEARQCFNVTEQICRLKEHISYEIVQATRSVQSCRKVTDRVCDVVFETEVKPKSNYQCIYVTNPHCADKEQAVNDTTCRTTTHFDCPESHVKIIRGQSPGYGASYGCKKNYDTRCYNTPRSMSMSDCQNREEKMCENVIEQVPFPVEKQVCHDDGKRVCELEQRVEPKQVKKYTYSKECAPQIRRVCDTVEVQKLVQNCVPATRKKCSLTPVEKCEDVHQKHCRRITEHVPTQKCDQPASQPAQQSYAQAGTQSSSLAAEEASYKASEQVSPSWLPRLTGE